MRQLHLWQNMAVVKAVPPQKPQTCAVLLGVSNHEPKLEIHISDGGDWCIWTGPLMDE